MMQLAQAAAALSARLQGADAEFTGVSTDTRTLQAGDLFIALKGERFDGHAHLAAAFEQGAAGAVVEFSPSSLPPFPLIAVSDSRRALGDLARFWRSRFALPLIAVVGSNGKTTVKEMIAAILAAQFGEGARLATQGNFNNDIGLPLTLLRLNAQHRAAVVELGMNHPQETRQLAAICQPTIALINNAQREHQEFMASVEAVAEEHALLLDTLPDEGVAIVNADDRFAAYWRARAGTRRKVDFGLGEAAVCVRSQPVAGGQELALQTPHGVCRTTLTALGAHNARNAAAATTAALAAGCDLRRIAQGLAAFRPVKGRLQPRRGLQDSILIDDSYNANPDSVRAAIDVLAQQPGQRILVLGDMAEVGAAAAAFHTEVGAYARQQGIDCLLTVGQQARAASVAFGAAACHYADMGELIATLRPALHAKVTTLVKGSRFMAMERIVAAVANSEHTLSNNP